MPPLDPDLHVKGKDRRGRPVVFTEKSRARGIVYYRRMTLAEIQAYEKSKTGKVKVQPAEIKGKPPT